MKAKITALLLLILIFGCCQGNKRPDANYYKNLFTEEVLDKTSFEEFYKDLLRKDYSDSNSKKESAHIHMHFHGLLFSGDSIIRPFNYDIRIGNEYIVRANSYEKIGMNIPPEKFQTVNGETIQIGGKQSKPILINLWFVECPGCVAEMPALNRLQEKYSDKVDFISMTFESETSILKFLKKKEFNFKHVANVDDFIKQIGTKPYPENIFINRDGCIKYIEGGLSDSKDLDLVIKHFESILDKLLEE